MIINVKTKELLEHCEEWSNEGIEVVEVEINEENGKKTLTINGLESDGLGEIISDLDPIEETPTNEIK
ncbi:hypothetical protein [Intestinimonas butyriciproducens]|uniref:hypothetical protein n=1 Tax=Intestinimonas butyriciproducens TaxID=1297617 RepID=UPI00189C7E12|nr:hypothetical protein [Intestinimonas butyriciproducens]